MEKKDLIKAVTESKEYIKRKTIMRAFLDKEEILIYFLVFLEMAQEEGLIGKHSLK